ncbi:MAG: hypothetical protein R3B94_08315 [Hyphomonas sp.]
MPGFTGTLEFGLIREEGGLRIYGAGILSSPQETVFALEDDSPNRIGFDVKRLMRTKYIIDDFQQTYFVIDSFESLPGCLLSGFRLSLCRCEGPAGLCGP